MNLKLSNRPVRTRMPGGVVGVQPVKAAPYADRVAWQPAARGEGAARQVAIVLDYAYESGSQTASCSSARPDWRICSLNGPR